MALDVAWTAADDVGMVHAQVWLVLTAARNYDLLLVEGPSTATCELVGERAERSEQPTTPGSASMSSTAWSA